MSKSRSREIDLLGESVAYEVRHSDEAAEPRIDVDIHGVGVVLPAESDTDPETLLADNAAWVLDKQRTYDSYREDTPERRFESGATFPYLGTPHEVTVERRQSSNVFGEQFHLAEHHVEQTSVKRALERLYRRKARDTFETRAESYAEKMDVEYNQIEIRNQRTKWGSCSTTGTLGMNWRLMMAPIGIVDYIVIHELAHLRESNHTDAFWSLVAEHDADYRDHAEWLEKNSTRLIFSSKDL
jgi:predicted metal-dependent hydrolase